jgi:hypothetical protein
MKGNKIILNNINPILPLSTEIIVRILPQYKG